MQLRAEQALSRRVCFTLEPVNTNCFGIVGFGTIGRLYASLLKELCPGCRLLAADTGLSVPELDDIPVLGSFEELLATDIPTVLIATPPALHFELTSRALEAERHVLVEKPPARSVQEAAALAEASNRSGTTLFFAYHARYNTCVRAAKSIVAGQSVKHFEVVYKENVYNFHPSGWIFREGVLNDSGINAFSILTEILPFASELRVSASQLEWSPAWGSDTRAHLELDAPARYSGSMDLDWCYENAEERRISVQTRTEVVDVDISNDEIRVNGRAVPQAGSGAGMSAEYKRMLSDFLGCIAGARSYCGTTELALLEAAYALGRRSPLVYARAQIDT